MDKTLESTAKNVILCLDGTDNEFGPKPFTNVLKLYRLLEKDSVQQICYYQSGIGSSFKVESTDISELSYGKSKYDIINSQVDTLIAFTLEKHVLDAYEFLARYYNENDRIFIFGFSRGSFTARIIAGMLEIVGLVHYPTKDSVAMAWDIYSHWEYSGQPFIESPKTRVAQQFKQTFSRKNVHIHFMGLWDTVNSVGFLWDRMFPFTIRSCHVKHIRHAVSIDERRSKFKQMLFATKQESCMHEGSSCSSCNSYTTQSSWASLSGLAGLAGLAGISDIIRRVTRGKTAVRPPPEVVDDLVEVFFPGDHADVGGGWPLDTAGQSLSNISFRWMLAQAIKFGVLFAPGSIKKWSVTNPSVASLFSTHHDALSFASYPEFNHIRESYVSLPEKAMNQFAGRSDDSFGHWCFWWMLECFPVFYKKENHYGEWRRVYQPNLGHHRQIPENCVLHWSYFYRLHYIHDYNPTNVPVQNISTGFLQSLSDFKLFTFNEVQRYAENLTVARIKNDWDGKIWAKIPDELAKLLEDNPNL
ncbi:uncharacterized protein LODBEIA_P35440 [Lodderomyces beijingensis]|uniref:T6SS Phospholipase effector Tle1-like catalytic domain-containing protein n=1 Tax=Lodderomyces beijingensis TaxID=1775926 RepID=A0ABP0ZQ38_9ASCO